MSDLSEFHAANRFDELAEEFAERYRRGERPSLEEYVACLPEMADEIREMFPAMAEVEQFQEDARDNALQRKPNAPLFRELGDYRIVREIGHGGMGVVYEAEQISLGRRVALKVLPGRVTRDHRALNRFRREAKSAGRLHHTNIVPVFEVGQQGDVAYYAMQFIQGQGLDEVIDELKRLGSPERNPGVKAKDNAGSGAGSGPDRSSSGEGVAGTRNRNRELVAESLLSGRLATEELKSTWGVDLPVADAAEKTPYDPSATVDGVARSQSQSVAASSPVAEVSSSAVFPGGTAVSMIRSDGRRLPFFRSVAQIGRQTAQGLAYAHSRGIVHRDIKPSNLLLDTSGIIWITDFGLAKAEDDGLTATGDTMGTILYMAPERFRGEGDARADIYALGLTLYELLTLRAAFATTDRLNLIERIKSHEPARPRSLDSRIPRDLETIVLKAIEKDPKRRYDTAEAMAEDLRRFLDDEPIQARRASAAERSARWARHHPTIAVLGAGLVAMLVLTTLASLVVASRMARLVQSERKAREAAQAETYHAVLSESKALRVGHQPGWREEALSDLARLAVMPTPRRDLTELRTEAAASLKTPDIHLAAKVELSDDLGSFAFSLDGRSLLTAGLKTGLDFWDLAGNSHRSSVDGLTVSESWFDLAIYLPDGRGLAVGTRDYGVVFTDSHGIRTSQAPITRGPSQPAELAVSADGKMIAVAWTRDGGITIHDAASGALLEQFDRSLFALSPDGRWLARAEGSAIVLRPIASPEPPIVLGRHHGANALAFSPDGSMLAVTFLDHTTVLWDVAKREPFSTLRGHHERVHDVAFSPDGEWIATASLDYTARIWETRTGQHVATLPDSSAMRRVKWSPTGEYLATRTNSFREICLYQISGRHDVQQWLLGHRVEVGSLAAHPSRERIATSGYNELISWDLSASRPSPVVMEPNPGSVTAVAYSPDGSRLLTVSWKERTQPPDVEILIRDATTGKIQSRISWSQTVWALAFNSAGNQLAFGDQAGNLVVWDLVMSRPVWQSATGFAVWSLVVLDGPRRLVTHSSDALLLFDFKSGELLRKVELGGGRIRAFVADRAHNRLVVGFESGAIGSVSLRDLNPGPRLENAHNGSVECLALTPDGRLLASAGADHQIVLRDAVSFETLLNFPMWVGNVRDLTFDFKGRRLIVVGTDCDVDLWDLTALHNHLTHLGLAWDQRPESAVGFTSGPALAGAHRQPALSVIRHLGATNPPTLERAR
jgi:eukaryotic-like serine/threonine-protein kinase